MVMPTLPTQPPPSRALLERGGREAKTLEPLPPPPMERGYGSPNRSNEEEGPLPIGLIVGHWLVPGTGGQPDTPAEVLSDGRVLFNGKDYGKDFHVKPTKDGGFLRGDGWKIHVGACDYSKTVTWMKEDEQPAHWQRVIPEQTHSLTRSHPSTSPPGQRVPLAVRHGQLQRGYLYRCRSVYSGYGINFIKYCRLNFTAIQVLHIRGRPAAVPGCRSS